MYPTTSQEIQNFARLKNEVEHYFYYSQLIQRRRTEEARKKVEDIIKRIPNILARIKEIESIDKDDQLKNPHFYQEKEKPERIKPAITYEDYKMSEPEPDKKKIKKIRVSGFFTFLLHDRKFLKNFASKTSMLSSRAFGLFYHFSTHFFRSLEDLNREINFNVVEAMGLILETGWTNLKKRQYNVSYYFFHFLKEFIVFASSVKFNSSASDVMKLMNNIIPIYLKIIKTETNRDVLVEAIQIVLSGNSRHKAVIPSLVELIFRLFSFKETGKVNFYQIFIAAYNLFFRKALKMDDIVGTYAINEITDKVFICDAKIARKIDERIERIGEELEEIEKELFVIKPIETDLNFFTFSHEDFVQVALKIIRSAKLGEKYKTEETGIIEYFNNDLLFGMQVFLKGFIRLYNNVLTADITINKNNAQRTVNLFDTTLFKEKMDKLKNQLKEIEDFRGLNSHINISSNIYASFLKTHHLEIEKDEKACNLIINAAKLFYNIYETLSQLLFNHHQVMTGNFNDPIQIQGYIEKTISEEQSSPRVIPYYFYKIVLEGYSANTSSVIDVLNDVAFFCANTAYLFDVEDILNFIRKKEILLSKSEALLKERAQYI